MKIYFIKEEMLLTLKNNIEVNIEKYKNDDSNWIVDYLGEDPFVEYKKEVDKINFNMTSEKPSEVEYENAIILHKALKNISRSEATDERFWAGLTHKTCWNYMKYRYSDINAKTNVSEIKNRYFFGVGEKRSLFSNPLARLWWVAESLYDKDNQNPYWLMEFFKSDFGTKALIIFSSNFTSNPNIVKGMFGAFLKHTEAGVKINRILYYNVCIYLNELGGNTILDYYSRDEIEQLCLNFLEDNQ